MSRLYLPKETHHIESIPRLQSAFGFDDEDLLANRYGEMTFVQQERWRKYYYANIVRSGGIVLSIGAGCGGFLYIFVYSQKTLFIFILLWLLAILLIKLASDFWKTYKPVQSILIRDDIVKDIAGKVFLQAKGKKLYTLSIGPYQFIINQVQHHVLYDHYAYRIYFISENFILSVEPTKHIDERFTQHY